MRILTTILSAGVVAGLITYAVLEAFQALSILTGDQMVLRIRTFVLTLALVGFGSAGLALLIRGAWARSERGALRALEDRIAALEARGL